MLNGESAFLLPKAASRSVDENSEVKMLSVMRSQAFQKFTQLFVHCRRIPLFPLVLFHANLEAANWHETFQMKHQFILDPNLSLLQSAAVEVVEFLRKIETAQAAGIHRSEMKSELIVYIPLHVVRYPLHEVRHLLLFPASYF